MSDRARDALVVTYRAADDTETEREVPEFFYAHMIEWTVSTDVVRGEIRCVADVGAWCRLECAEECGSESWPCYGWVTEDFRMHPMVDAGHCNVLPFFEELNAEESYEGPTHQAVSGPIQLQWKGDTYVWSYPDEVAS